jgi:hypothetical protein
MNTIHAFNPTNATTTACNLGVRQAEVYDNEDTTTDRNVVTCEDCIDALAPATTKTTGADAVIDAFGGNMTWI